MARAVEEARPMKPGLLALGLLLLAACGGRVVVDAAPEASMGAGGGVPAQDDVVACPAASGSDITVPGDQIEALVGKPCGSSGATCDNNNGCGGCFVTCKDGLWAPEYDVVCYSVDWSENTAPC